MGKKSNEGNQMREKCVKLHKSGSSDKKIATCLKMPISTIRLMLKKFKATGTVTNLPGKGLIQRKVVFWGHQFSKTTIRCHLHANKLFGRHARKKLFLSFHH